MNTSNVRNQYKDVGKSLQDALDKTSAINVSGVEENQELAKIIETLGQMNERFKDEINKLESSAEWGKFCISFFGETNAGKSTIIDSLRILYDEESRHLALLKKQEDYCKLFGSHLVDYQKLVDSLKNLRETTSQLQIKPNSFVALFQKLLLLGLGSAIGYFVPQFF